MEALLMHDDNWKSRDESLLDLVDEILTEEEAAVVNLVVIGRWTFRDFARERGISVGYAHKLKVRALDKLRKALGDEGVRNGCDEE